MKGTILLVAALCIAGSGSVYGQILNPKKLLEKKATEKANKALEKKPDAPLDTLQGKKPQAKAGDQQKNAEPAVAGKPDSAGRPGLQAYSRYDFMPGEKQVFYEDFSQENIGDFPAAWNTNGSAEVVTTNLYEGHWLQFNTRNAIWTDALLDLPENYTVEFDVIPIKGEEGGMAGYTVRLMQSINARAFDAGAVPGKAGFMYAVEYFGRPGYRSYINGDEGQGLGLSGTREGKDCYQKMDQKYHVAIWVQKSRVRLYVDENKLFDLPKAFPLATVKFDRLRFEDGAAMIGNIRIAVGAPDMRSKLLTEGKLVSYGIYFDTNKDLVKPESYASLKEIAGILKENPALRIRIAGHTDADGAEAANLDLSRRRAEAVKRELVLTFGIDASRMETEGRGETEPVAANDSPSNKALNRRVEFIRL